MEDVTRKEKGRKKKNNVCCKMQKIEIKSLPTLKNITAKKRSSENSKARTPNNYSMPY
jgi:hypothetical protein